MTGASSSTVLVNARVATFDPAVSADYGLLNAPHAITIRNGVLAAITPMTLLRPDKNAALIDLGGKLVTPGFIDCHTHIVFGGDRSTEWEMRLKGKSYSDIAQAGGGILSTVRATRACSEDELFQSALKRLHNMAREGVTCVEVKSGYGLSLEEELKALRVIGRLKRENLVDISATLLAAHTVPPEFKSNNDAYVSLMCDTLIPHVAREGLAEAVDVFCEPIAFSLAQCERVFDAAHRHGLAIKAHAEQLSYTGSARSAAQRGAQSVDHLEHLPATDIPSLKASGTVAVLLPGAFYALRETKRPPIEELRRSGIPMAVATDCNPGTSPFTSIRMILNLSCILFALSPAEALTGVPRNAAQALGRLDRMGTVTAGKEATLCVWDVQEPASLVSDLTINPLVRVFIRGEERHA